MNKNTVDMTAGSPARHILNFTVPLILTNMGQQLYMIVDGAIVGRGVGVKALGVSVRYLTVMVLCFPILHILHIFRNVLQALGIAIWSLMSGFAELAARILMSKCLIGYIGADALFLSEPASCLGAMLCVFLPYFYYRKKLLR